MKPSQIKKIKMICVFCDNTDQVDIKEEIKQIIQIIPEDDTRKILESLNIKEMPDGGYAFTGICPLCEKRNKQKKVVWN